MTRRELTIVIPTRDRREALGDTLDALDAQSLPVAAAEIVVVDNGSRDGTTGALAARAGRRPVRVLREPRPGPAAARNTGVAAAQAPLVLLIGDDMAPAAPDLLERHVALHAARPEAAYAVLGRAVWSPRREITPFMHWLDGGIQFRYHELAPGPVAASSYFYTSHVSLKREALELHPFDERFPFAAVEDTELGARLEKWGMELDYHPELVVDHDHPTDVWAYARRMERVGASARLLHEIASERRDLMPGPSPRWRLAPVAGPVARGLLRAGFGDRPRLWSALLWSRYADGYTHAERILPPGTLPG